MRAGAANIFGEMICDEREPTEKDSPRKLQAQILRMVARVVDVASAEYERPLATGGGRTMKGTTRKRHA